MTEEECRDGCEHDVDVNCEYCIYDGLGCYCETDPCCEAGCDPETQWCDIRWGIGYCIDYDSIDNSGRDVMPPIRQGE